MFRKAWHSPSFLVLTPLLLLSSRTVYSALSSFCQYQVATLMGRSFRDHHDQLGDSIASLNV